MTDLPNPFSDSGVVPSGTSDEAAALTRSHAPGAAAEIQLACSSVVEQEAVNFLVAGSNPAPPANQQRLLEAIEDDYRFVLNEEKFLFDIGCVPEDFAKYMAMMEGLVDHDEPPLFIQEQKRA